MRPALLDPLFAPAGALAGVGPKNAKLFDRLLDRAAGRARHRCAVPSALRGARPARAAENPRRRSATRSPRSKCASPSIARRRTPRSKAPFKVLVEDDTGDVELVFFLANHRLDQEAPAARRDALGFGQARNVGRPFADGPSRPGDGRRGARQNAGGRAGLRPDRRPVSARASPRRRRARWRACRACPNGSTPPTLQRVCSAPSFAEALGALHNPRNARRHRSRRARRDAARL